MSENDPSYDEKAPCYSSRFDDALALATAAFRCKTRKGSSIPYLSHLLQVTVTVAEYGGDEDQMIAAVLHDYLEDIEGSSAGELAERFGHRVADLVVGLSDSTSHPKPPWKERKIEHVAHLKEAPADLKLVCCADKLHNARSIYRDLLEVGESVFDRFYASPEQTLWYYRAIVESLRCGWSHKLLDQLEAEVLAIHAAVGF